MKQTTAIGPLLGMRLGTTAFLALLVPVYWREYGPQNLLWFSDVALFTVVIALWTRHPLPASMAAVGVLAIDIVWTIDFLLASIAGSSPLRITTYMRREDIPAHVRALSLFHLAMPPGLVWLLFRWGYDRRGLAAQTLLAWLVLPVTYALTEPASNINLVFGPGAEPQETIPPLAYLGVMMAAVPAVVYVPTHLILCRLFERPRPRDT